MTISNKGFSRRRFFKTLGKTAGYIALATSLPSIAWAKWSEKAFSSKTLDSAIKACFGDLPIADNPAVKLDVPDIAENGAMVGVGIKTELENVKSVAVFVEKNPAPLCVKYNFGKGTIPDVETRVRMGETSNLIAIVEADGKLHRSQKLVKVTIGGCGG